MAERRGSVYDPARDLFTKSDDIPEGAMPEEAVASPSPEPQQQSLPKRKRAGTEDADKMKKDKEDAKKATASDATNTKRLKASPDISTPARKEPPPMTVAALASIPRAKKAPSSQQRSQQSRRSPDARRRSRSPRRDRRSPPPRRRSPSPGALRSPSPPARSPPRQRKRPGAASRLNRDDVEQVKRRQEQRERAETEAAREEAARRGVADVVTQHYNAVPQRGREWRQTSSRIKGLRSFNNWIKSAVIQKFSPDEVYTPGSRTQGINGSHQAQRGLRVLDIGCGKGGDIQKWQSAPQQVDLYVGLDPADISIAQAKERFNEMVQKNRKFRKHTFEAHFVVRDCFGEWLGHVPVIREVGIDPTIGPDGHNGGQPRQGGFDVVSLMFCMHYAFESEAKARGMLKNVAGALKKGGRFIGVIPNSDVISAKVLEFNKARGYVPNSSKIATPAQADDEDDDWDPERPAGGSMKNGRPLAADDSDDDDWDPEKSSEAPKPEQEPAKADEEDKEEKEDGEIDGELEWGNGIYRVKFPGKVPKDGVFRPSYNWKYFYFLEEAVEEIPEYVVPWEGFRYLASQYDLELQYRKPFNEVWDAEKDDPILGPLSERMGVRGHGRGRLLVSDEEMEAVSFYHAFCFYKT